MSGPDFFSITAYTIFFFPSQNEQRLHQGLFPPQNGKGRQNPRSLPRKASVKTQLARLLDMAAASEKATEVRIILGHRAVVIKWDDHGSPLKCGLCHAEFVLRHTWITRSVNAHRTAGSGGTQIQRTARCWMSSGTHSGITGGLPALPSCMR